MQRERLLMAELMLDRVHIFNLSSTEKQDYIIPSAAIKQRKVCPSIQASWTWLPRLQCCGNDIMYYI